MIPAGSGNGLARMLAMPAEPDAGAAAIVRGRNQAIDVGDIDGRLFVNVAGVGFDAHIAGCFAAIGRARRGFLRYAAIVVAELRTVSSRTYTLELDPRHRRRRRRAFLLWFANGRQWGNGAIIAP